MSTPPVEGPAPTCGYCGATAALMTGARVYGHRPELRGKLYWVCAPCGAWVGASPTNGKPLGTLAKADLRKARRRAHDALDRLWAPGRAGTMSRSGVYYWLRGRLGADGPVYIGLMDQAACERVVELCERELGRV